MSGHWMGDPVSTPDDGWEQSVHQQNEYNKAAREKARNLGLPRNHGTLWNKVNDRTLERMHTAGMSIQRIADDLGRTEVSITSRLKHLGLVVEDQHLAVSQPMKGINVNHVHLITLLQQGYTTVHVRLTGDSHPSRDYTYKAPTDWDLKPMDRVVVPTRDSFSIGMVTKVDDEPDVDMTKPYGLKWVVQKVDFTAYDEHVVKEAAALKQLKDAQKKKAVEDAMHLLFGEAGVNVTELKKLLNG